MTHTEKLEAAFEAMKAVIEVLGSEGHCELQHGIGKLRLIIFVNGKDRAHLHDVRRKAGLGNIRKDYYVGSQSGMPVLVWEGDTLYGCATLSIHNACTLLGYEEKIIPAQPERVERKPIYKCS